MYRKVNDLFGDVIKVTPSSKIVGDMAMFLVQNNLEPEDVYERGMEYTFPQGVVDFFKGMIGQPVGGFPAALQAKILKGEQPLTVRPGSVLEPVDFEAVRAEAEAKEREEKERAERARQKAEEEERKRKEAEEAAKRAAAIVLP